MRKKQKKKARAEKANSKTKGTTTLARSPREAGTKDCLDSSLGLTKGSDQETFPAKLDASKLGPSTAQIDIGSHASGDAKDESRIPILTKAMELDEVPGGCLRPLPRNSAAPVTSSAHTPCSPPQDSASYTAISDDTPQAQAPDSRNNIFSEGPSFYDHQTVAQSSTVQVSKKHSDHSNDRPKASCMDQIQAEDKKEDDHGNKNASATSTIHPGTTASIPLEHSETYYHSPGLEFINHDDSQGAVTELRDKAADGSGLNEHQGSTVPNPAAKPLGPLSGTSTATGISVSDHPNIKKKPKKKKKKVLNSADPETAVEDVAFTEQVKQIDDLKDDPETIFCSSPQNYFASRDAAMAQTASRSIRKSTVNAGPPDSQEPKEIVKKVKKPDHSINT
ncbi:hypothetical protein BU24DRAFT_150626 [Aaosphaeria arxii CBS 175.79]|uniref:Uncharacterized protein n=1 Tax=Aaosphaeria arxii CBS 175.79 TaxID=1450172 RepID=A0A6A5XX76_9PLEO|nr:uncharacterized protein BU24DRAFT_150626 [Aaosphaeria arxii CBS 175.79]KAF2017437.1 hypothetical protein BU24DRAFT_150626 [Aaosphaeria arxii CBS 175.79]